MVTKFGNKVKCSDHPPFNITVPSTSETDSLWENGKSELSGMSFTGNWFGIPESRWSIESSNLSAFSALRQRHDRYFSIFSYKSFFSLHTYYDPTVNALDTRIVQWKRQFMISHVVAGMKKMLAWWFLSMMFWKPKVILLKHDAYRKVCLCSTQQCMCIFLHMSWKEFVEMYYCFCHK